MSFTIIRFENRVVRGCALLAGSAAERLVASGSRASLCDHKLVMVHDFTMIGDELAIDRPEMPVAYVAYHGLRGGVG